jgi:DNA-binding transcriptional LysR family regulator
MPLAVATFRKRHPDIELAVKQLEPEDSIPMLKAGELDIALTVDETTIAEEYSESIETTLLMEDPMYAVLPAGHLLAAKSKLHLKDLAQESWINTTQSCSCADMVRNSAIRAGFDLQVAFESDDYLAIQGLVAAGVGVALIPSLALTTVRDDIVIRDLSSEAPVRQISAATLSGAQRSPATRAMLDVLIEVSSEYREQSGPQLALVS